MDKITIYNMEQRSNAWFEIKCGRIGASRFKDLMMGKTTVGYTGLINEIVGQILTGEMDEGFINDDMQTGIDREPIAANDYDEIYGVQSEEVGFITNEDVFPEYFGVSPDRMIGKNILEIKCPKSKTHVGYFRDGKLPTVYKWQVQGQILITGADYCDFMSYYPNLKPFIIRVFPDKEMQSELKQRMKETIKEIKEVIKSVEKQIIIN